MSGKTDLPRIGGVDSKLRQGIPCLYVKTNPDLGDWEFIFLRQGMPCLYVADKFSD